MNELQVKGTQEFLGINIPIVEGGFGEGQKVILAKTIADIHGVRLNDVQDLINANINEFEFGIDILDLCNEDFKTEAVGLGFITSNRQLNCYLLSEQGYMLLVGFMRSEKAKEIRKKLRREYFAMRKIINSNEQLKANLLLSIYNGGKEGILASKQLTEIEVKEATTPLLAKIEENKPKAEFYDDVAGSKDAISIGEVAKILGIKNLGRNKLFQLLRDKKILRPNNQPYQQFIDKGYFRIIEQKWLTENGDTKINIKTLVYQKGLDYIRRIVKES